MSALRILRSARVDLPELLLLTGALLFGLCLYTSPAALWPWLEPLRPAQSAALLLAMGVVARWGWRGQRPPAVGGIGRCLAGLAGLAALSALWSLDPSASAGFAVEAAKLVAIWLGLLAAIDRPSRLRLLMALCGLAAVVPAVGTLRRYHEGTGLVEGFRGAWIGLLANPNQLAMVMAVTVPWTLCAAGRTHGLRRWSLRAAAVAQGACVVVTHSRGGALGLGAALLVGALLAEQRGRSLAGLAIAMAAVAWLAPESFAARTGTITRYEADASAQGRLRSWETGLQSVQERPLLGAGAAAYVHTWDRHTPRNIRERAYTAHNMWMQVLVELGLAGLSLLGGVFVLLVRGLWRSRHHRMVGAEARALLAGLTALLVCGTTGGYAFNWFFYLSLALGAGAIRLAAAVVPHGKTEEANDGLGVVIG